MHPAAHVGSFSERKRSAAARDVIDPHPPAVLPVEMLYVLRRDGPEDSPRLREIHTSDEVVHPKWSGGQWTAQCRARTAADVLRSRRYQFELVSEHLEPGEEAGPPARVPVKAPYLVRAEPEALRAAGVEVLNGEPPPRRPVTDWERWQARTAKKRHHIPGAEVGDLWQRLRGRVGDDLLLRAQEVARSGAWLSDGGEDVGVVKVMHGFDVQAERATEAALDAVVALGPRSRVVVVQNDARAAGAFRAWAPRAHADRYTGIVVRNDGYAAACNAGAKKCRGNRWLLFTQPDASWGADAVRDAIGLSLALQEGPVGFGRPALVGPSGGACDDPYNGSLVEWGRNLPRDRGKAPAPVQWLAGYWLLTDGEAFRSVGGWDERFFLYYEDPDLSLRLAFAGCRPFAWPALAVDHERGSTIRSRVEDSVISEMQGESRVTFGAIWGGR